MAKKVYQWFTLSDQNGNAFKLPNKEDILKILDCTTGVGFTSGQIFKKWCITSKQLTGIPVWDVEDIIEYIRIECMQLVRLNLLFAHNGPDAIQSFSDADLPF